MIKREIRPEDLPVCVKSLRPSRYGHTDTVYIADDKYVVKIYEFASVKQVEEEIQILKLSPSSPKVLSEIFYIDSRPALVFEKLSGEVIKSPEALHVKQIGEFLVDFHSNTKGKTSSNPKLFRKERLKELVLQSQDQFLMRSFEALRVNLKCEGLIHGDLFLDNVLFEDDRLSGVIDFTDSCEGDFGFDLAVVAFSWGLDDGMIDLLLKTYGLEMAKDEFKEYMKYALLCYCASRAVAGRDYYELKNRLERLI